MTHTHDHDVSGPGRKGDGSARKTATDPVCGMKVDPLAAKHFAEVDGTTYHFCSAGCGAKFKADPQKYLRADDPGEAAEPPPPPGTTFTCPMHPEVRREGPGSCPKCGMALEPETPSLDSGPNAELLDMRLRLWIGLALTAPVFLLEMGGHVPAIGLDRLVPERASTWIQFALSTPVVLWAGWPFFERAWSSVVNRSLNMFSLIALGTGAAYLYSVVATLAPGLFPSGFRGMGGTVAVYFEAAAVITVLVLLGQVLELRARDQTGGAIRALLQLAPKTARRVREGADDEVVGIEDVAAGDTLRIRPGNGVPVDGIVLEGRSAVDESMVTGESMPVAKERGGKLIGGTVNGTGPLTMRAERVGADSMLSRIVTMVAEAQRSRAPIQRTADRVAGGFGPAVLACAVAAVAMRTCQWNPPPSSPWRSLSTSGAADTIAICDAALATASSIRPASCVARTAVAEVSTTTPRTSAAMMKATSTSSNVNPPSARPAGEPASQWCSRTPFSVSRPLWRPHRDDRAEFDGCERANPSLGSAAAFGNRRRAARPFPLPGKRFTVA